MAARITSNATTLDRNVQLRIRMAVDVERRTIDNIPFMRKRFLENLTVIAQEFAADVENQMQTDAEWQDWNENREKERHEFGDTARSGLYAKATRRGDVLAIAAGYRDDVFHTYTKKDGSSTKTYTYGGILETYSDGRTNPDGAEFAVVIPTMRRLERQWPAIVRDAFQAVGSLGAKPTKGRRR